MIYLLELDNIWLLLLFNIISVRYVTIYISYYRLPILILRHYPEIPYRKSSLLNCPFTVFWCNCDNQKSPVTREVIELVPFKKLFQVWLKIRMTYIHSLLDFIIIPAASFTVSSTGPAATRQPTNMGVYHQTTKSRFNDFPVYEKTGDDRQFLYVNNYGQWVIMR